MNGEQRPRLYFACTQDELNLLILCKFEDIFSLDVARRLVVDEGDERICLCLCDDTFWT